MAIFCYKSVKSGEYIEKVFPCGKAPKTLYLDGKRFYRDYLNEFRSHGGVGYKPRKSIALAVHPTQVKMFNELSSKAGCATEHDEKGHPVFTSKEQRRKYCEWRGATDFDGGYGDPTIERRRHA